MQTHQRPGADCADRRTTITRCRSVIAATLVLALLAAGCGSNPAVDTASATPQASQRSDDIVPATVDAVDGPDTVHAIGIPEDGVTGLGDADDLPDYSDAELEVLLDAPAANDDGLDPPEAEPLEAGSPSASIEAIESALDASPQDPGEATPVLDKVEPLDDAPTAAAFGLRDGRRINEVGEAVLLDEAAALACANVEIALTALDENQVAEVSNHLRTASTVASDSTVPAMDPWPSILDRTAAGIDVTETDNGDVSVLLAFLATCTQGGYEL